MYGRLYPKNCYCYKQLAAISCYGPYHTNIQHCVHGDLHGWSDIICFVYKGLPEDQQLSDPPGEGNVAGVTEVVWMKGQYKKHQQGSAFVYPFSFEDVGDEDRHRAKLATEHGAVIRPMAACPQRCNDRGYCTGQGASGRCHCPPTYTGDSCQDTILEDCPLGCSGRGRCLGGFCHCQEGWWGPGCTRSQAFKQKEWTPNPVDLKIYVYDLPETVSYLHYRHDLGHLQHDDLYMAEQVFYHRLLADWAVRTENPWEANLFFVPTNTYFYTSNTGFPYYLFQSVFDHVRTTYPWWNMTGGRNHVAVAVNDRGCCDLYRTTTEVQRPIKLVHWGQAPRHRGPVPRNASDVPVRVPWTDQLEGLAGLLGSSLQDPAMLGAMLEWQQLAVSGRERFKGFAPFGLAALQQEREVCYRPDHDCVMPPFVETRSAGMGAMSWPEVMAQVYDTGGSTPRFRQDKQRDMLFYFSGYSRSDMAYSMGVRQAVIAMFGNSTRKDIAINKIGVGPEAMLRTRFCLAPPGLGWGRRLTEAVFAGCVPVLVHDHVYPPLWELLPYERFSLRLNRHNLHRLLDVLDGVTPEQLGRLQQGLAEVHRAFVWSPELGGAAYNLTLQCLHRKLTNMWTSIF